MGYIVIIVLGFIGFSILFDRQADLYDEITKVNEIIPIEEKTKIDEYR